MLGLNVRFIKGFDRPPIYPNIGEVDNRLRGELHNIKAPHLKELAEEAKVIHYIGSTFIDTGVDINKKKIVIQHGGTTYRQHYSRYLHPFEYTTIIQTPDLLGLGAKNEHWISFPVQTDILSSNYSFESNTKVIVGHHPSNPKVKGSNTILNVIRKLEADPELYDKFIYDGFEFIENEQGKLIKEIKILKWDNHLDKVRKCDIYIEACSPMQEKKIYGEWGNSAVEAAALGKIVITHSQNKSLYEKEYGTLPFYIANNEYEIEIILRHLLSLSRNELWIKKRETRLWVCEYHSMEATSQRLWEKIYERLIYS